MVEETDNYSPAKPMSSWSKLTIYAVILAGICVLINNYWLKLSQQYFWGIYFGLLIVSSVIIQLVIRYLDKKSGLGNRDNAFIFPSDVAEKMKNVSTGIQMEASIISLTFLIIGMLIFSIYFVFITDFTWWYKVFYLFNAVCGGVLMTSTLVTQYNQYVSYKESLKLQAFVSSAMNLGSEVTTMEDLTNGRRK